MKKNVNFGLCIAMIFLVSISCSSLRRKHNLTPAQEEFLSEVRYIITKQERKIFLNLPPEERKAFIEEFWKKRDPDPQTDTNEFKERYFQRIEEANHLFKEGGSQGWLTDRGRIYILLGPPEHREKYPTGYTIQGSPLEIWYYGPAQIIFIDYYYDGNYELYPISAHYLANLINAQLGLKPEIEDKEHVLDFKIKLEKFPPKTFKIIISVPYKNIWFKEKETRLETTLNLNLEITTKKKEKVWSYSEAYPISISPEEITNTLGKNYQIEALTELEPGTYRLHIFLENTTDSQKVEKTLEFKANKI